MNAFLRSSLISRLSASAGPCPPARRDVHAHHAGLPGVRFGQAPRDEIQISQADPNFVDAQGNTQLHMAARKGNLALAKALLEAGANPNAANEDGMTPLHHATYESETKLALLLLDHGADPFLPCVTGFTPFYNAHIHLNKELIGRFMERVKDPNQAVARGETALQWLIKKGDMALAKAFMAKGAIPNLGTLEVNENSLLYWVTYYGDKAFFEDFLKESLKRPEFNVPSQKAALLNTLLGVAVLGGKKEIALSLLDQEADPNSKNTWGEPMLSSAVHRGDNEIVLKLLEKGADPNQPDKGGKFPLANATHQHNPDMISALLAHGATPHKNISDKLLVELLKSPADFINTVMRHQQTIGAEAMRYLFHDVEFSEKPHKGIVPELMALLPLYARKVKEQGGDVGQASAAITRIYDFLGKVDEILGIGYNNWGTLGTLGLSFSRWKFDAMQMWKNAGPMQKAPLLVQSGLFKPVPGREDDPQYFNSFLHYDPKTGLSVELRRAYIAISKPGLGSVVIRNSSHHYGRNLFQEPAYYHPDKQYSQGENLLKPSDLWDSESGYMNVLGTEMNNSTFWQEKHHTKIAALLTDFQTLMDRYTDWKCGFKDGKPPEGFKSMLEAAVLSGANDGAMSPYGKQKHLRLAWVNPYELPAPVSTLDLSQPAILQEAQEYLKVLKGQARVMNSQEFSAKMPMLMAFLSDGLRQGLELVLV